MGIVKIADDLHEEVRRASAVMCRSINAQAEFWMKVGMLAEANPTLSFTEIVQRELAAAQVHLPVGGYDADTEAAAA
ncbi:ParD-like family protein [Novosphingobium sp. KA1]|uniref:ParD-like family protein n=1 Tax=Novosphingobium sp. (strain KA1) TaxID=164608 RepID=UPI001A90A8A8|nr:ParD-like family protein [Novosphingobium sp. KA1]QSR18320.1 hypothetical protein CA833_14160 [Novosphingobium sp. KA1]